MDISLLARGGVPVQLDRERILFFNAEATWTIYQRYGQTFWHELLVPGAPILDEDQKEIGQEPPSLKSLESLQFFLWVGLQEDAKRNGETLTLERVGDFIRPMTINALTSSLSIALTLQNFAPEPAGKAEAETAGPAAAAGVQAPKSPKRRSTSTSSSGSRTARSAGPKSSSGKRRSRK